MNWLGPVSASLLAGAISAIELTAGQKKFIPLRAIHWVGIRFGIDGATAAIAYGVTGAALKGLDWFHGPWQVLLSGLVGPALLRSQLALLGSGEESTYFGPATSYRRLQSHINTAIDDVASASQARWVVLRVLPGLANVPLETSVETARVYVKSLERLNSRQKHAEEKYLDELLLDTSSVEDKYRSLVSRLIELGGRRLVKQLLKKS